MANIKVIGEQPLQIMAHSFVASPSTQGYVLNYSADGVNYTAYDKETPANETLIVNGLAWGTFIKLVGNGDEIIIRY